jgi:hypothetical protein
MIDEDISMVLGPFGDLPPSDERRKRWFNEARATLKTWLASGDINLMKSVGAAREANVSGRNPFPINLLESGLYYEAAVFLMGNSSYPFDGFLRCLSQSTAGQDKYAAVISCLAGCNLFLTRQGHVGIAHRVHKGDSVVLMSGCSEPFILRPDEGKFRVIGPTRLSDVCEQRIPRMWDNIDIEELEEFRLI